MKLTFLILFLIHPNIFAERPDITKYLDSTFGSKGIFTDTSPFIPHCIAEQKDGKILITGKAGRYPNPEGKLFRLTTTGELDIKFGTKGAVTTTQKSSYFGPIALQSDGKILVSGTTDTKPTFSVTKPILERYDSDGVLDKTFNPDMNTWPGPCKGWGNGARVLVQNDGKILFGYYCFDSSTHQAFLVRLDTQGNIDSSFNANGVLPLGIAYNAAFNLRTDGKIFITTKDEIRLYETDGKSFSVFAKVKKPEGIFENKDGSVVTTLKQGTDLILKRYLKDGTPDLGFGNKGELKVAFAGDELWSTGYASGLTGEFSVFGLTTDSWNERRIEHKLVQFKSSGTILNEIDLLDPNPLTGIPYEESNLFYQNDGRLIVIGSSNNPIFWEAKRFK